MSVERPGLIASGGHAGFEVEALALGEALGLEEAELEGDALPEADELPDAYGLDAVLVGEDDVEALGVDDAHEDGDADELAEAEALADDDAEALGEVVPVGVVDCPCDGVTRKAASMAASRAAVPIRAGVFTVRGALESGWCPPS